MRTEHFHKTFIKKKVPVKKTRINYQNVFYKVTKENGHLVYIKNTDFNSFPSSVDNCNIYKKL